MRALTEFCPAPPDYHLDWAGMDAEYDWVRALEACEQEPEWHAEGNVWIHTRMVLEALIANPAWRALSLEDRQTVFCACALHDVAKPETTKRVDGRWSARGHSSKGAFRAREILWRHGLPLAQRESISHLVLHHQVPFFLVERTDAEAVALRISWTTRADLLALVTEADGRGRECRDQARLFENIEMFQEMCREFGCLDGPRPFASPRQRVAYFQDTGGHRHPDAPVAPTTRCTVTLLSGLPAAGKDTWIAEHAADAPCVSLDDLRRALGANPRDGQRAVIDAARERAREHLRAERNFVWNATNLSLDVRRPLLRLCADYGADVEIVHVEVSPEELAARNRARDEPVPAAAIERMLRRWQVPDLTEAVAVRTELS